MDKRNCRAVTRIILSLIPALFLLGVAGETHAAERLPTLYVKDGNLQAAVDKAPAHAIVMADRTKQIEIVSTVRITKPLTLVGLNARLKPRLAKTPILAVLAEGVRIRDFLLEGNADSVTQPERAPLIVVRRGRFVVENGETNNSAKDGVMITPIAQYGDIEHGVVRNLIAKGTVRDAVSIGGAGDEGLFVRHLVVENIRAYRSELRGAVEVSDGSEYITVRDIYAESSFYGVDVQDHDREGQVNRHVVIDGVHVKDCTVAIRTANSDFGHDGLTIRNITGTDWRKGEWSPLDIRNTANVLIDNVRIHRCPGEGSVTVRNSDNVTLRNLTFTDCGNDGAPLLVEDANNVLIDNVVFQGAAQPEYGVLYRVRSDSKFRGLRIRNVLAEDVRSVGIVLENVSSSGGLESYLITDNISTIRADLKADQRLVRNNLAPGKKLPQN